MASLLLKERFLHSLASCPCLGKYWVFPQEHQAFKMRGGAAKVKCRRRGTEHFFSGRRRAEVRLSGTDGPPTCCAPIPCLVLSSCPKSPAGCPSENKPSFTPGTRCFYLCVLVVDFCFSCRVIFIKKKAAFLFKPEAALLWAPTATLTRVAGPTICILKAFLPHQTQREVPGSEQSPARADFSCTGGARRELGCGGASTARTTRRQA